MSSTIYKYELDIVDEQVVELPYSHRILCVGNQRGVLCMWARVDPITRAVKRKIIIKGTGHPFTESQEAGKYVGTAIFDDLGLVWHVFDGGDV